MTPHLIERSIDVIVFLAVAWPALRAAGSPRFSRTFPQFARRLSAFAVVYLVAVTVTALVAPPWMARLGALAAALWIGAVHWHARISHGQSRRHPPGSLEILPLDAWFDRTFFLDRFRRVGSPFKTSHFIRPMVCLVGLADGLNFLKDHESALASPSLPFGRFIPGGFIRHMPPQRHASTRQLFRAAFAREVYEPVQPQIRDAVRAELVRAAGCGGDGIAPRSHIQRLVFQVWARLFFNVCGDDAAMPRLKELYTVIDIRNPTRAADDVIQRALDEIAVIATGRLRDDEASRGEIPRSFLEAIAMNDREAVADQTSMRNLIYLLHTSWADVSGLLTWLWRMLTEHPEWAATLRNSSDDTAMEHESALANRIVMETLRLEQSEQLYRVVTATIEHQGFVIPRGWLVRLCVRESHQDAMVFDRPEQFNPDRFRERTYGRKEYSAFGGNLRHACLGEGLTMMMGRLLVEELSTGFDWHTTADGEYEYGPWRHWRPSSDWRVQGEVRRTSVTGADRHRETAAAR